MKGFRLKIGVALVLMVVSRAGTADVVDRYFVESLWAKGDSGLVCQIHENPMLKRRCEEMAGGVEKIKQGGAGSHSELNQQNPLLSAAIYHPSCRSLQGLQMEQCSIRETLKFHERQPTTAGRASFILSIIGRGQ